MKMIVDLLGQLAILAWSDGRRKRKYPTAASWNGEAFAGSSPPMQER